MKWLSFSIYILGMLGILINKRNIIKILLSIELMLVGITLNMLISSLLIDDVLGLIFGIFILTVAASESAIGLGILISYYELRYDLNIKNLNIIKG